MGRRCAVVNCKSGTFKDVSRRAAEGFRPITLFGVPKRESALRTWSIALRQELSAKDYVCELHFSNDSVIRESKTALTDGTVYVFPRKRPMLAENSIPMQNANAEKENVAPVVETQNYIPFRSGKISAENYPRASLNAPLCTNKPEPVGVASNEPFNGVCNLTEKENDVQGFANDLLDSSIESNEPEELSCELVETKNDIQTWADDLMKSSSESDQAEELTCKLDDTQIDSQGFADHLLDDSSESSTDNKIDTTNALPDEYTNVANDQSLSFVIEEVFNRLQAITLLPERWCWATNQRQERSIIFVQLDVHTQLPRLRVVLYKDLSVSVHTADGKVDMGVKSTVTSMKSLEKFLNDIGRNLICDGTGIDEQRRDQSCTGFIGPNEYTEHVIPLRCIFCRKLKRKIQNRSQRRRTDLEIRYKRLQQRSNEKRLMCIRLRRKVHALMEKFS